jgi:hypothetical protein
VSHLIFWVGGTLYFKEKISFWSNLVQVFLIAVMLEKLLLNDGEPVKFMDSTADHEIILLQ